MLLIGWECDVDLVEMRRERESAVTRGAGLGSDTAIHGMTLTKSASTSGGVQVFGRLGAALLLTSIILCSGAPAAQEKCASLRRAPTRSASAVRQFRGILRFDAREAAHRTSATRIEERQSAKLRRSNGGVVGGLEAILIFGAGLGGGFPECETVSVQKILPAGDARHL